jgi:hypothetical protein
MVVGSRAQVGPETRVHVEEAEREYTSPSRSSSRTS